MHWCIAMSRPQVLFGCCSSWFLLDVAFYANNLFTPTVMQDIGYVPQVGAACLGPAGCLQLA